METADENRLMKLREIERLAGNSGRATILSFACVYFAGKYSHNITVMLYLAGSLIYLIPALFLYIWSVGQAARLKKSGPEAINLVTDSRLEFVHFWSRVLNKTYMLYVLFALGCIVYLLFFWLM